MENFEQLKNDILNFFGYLPTFHDDVIKQINFNNNVLTFTITTKNNILTKWVFEKHPEAKLIETTFKFENLSIKPTQQQLEEINKNNCLAKFSFKPTEDNNILVCIIFLWGEYDLIFTCKSGKVEIKSIT